MYRRGPILAFIRRQVDSLNLRFSRELAILRILPVAGHVVDLWNIALAKQQPEPDPITCIRKFTDAGISLPSFKALHIYLKDRGEYGGLPDAVEISEKLFPRGQEVSLSTVPRPNLQTSREGIYPIPYLWERVWVSPSSPATYLGGRHLSERK